MKCSSRSSVWISTGLLFLLTVSSALISAPPARGGEFDWLNWRGPEQNNTSRETGLIDKFNPKGGAGSNLLWKSKALATRSTPIVMNGRLYTLCRKDPRTATDGEKVVCADAATGKILWENKFNVYLSDVPAERVGWSNLSADPTNNRIYALGVCGYFQCIDAQTGKTIWSQSLHEKFGLLSTYGGRTNTPVIFEDLVIVSAVVIGWGEMAKPTHRFLAFDKNTGGVVWFTGTRPLPYDTTYSTPVITVLGGQASLVFGSGDGSIRSFQPRTGKPIWRYPFSRRGVNVSPLVVGDRIYVGHSEENVVGTSSGAIVALDGTKTGDITTTGEIWIKKKAMIGKSSPTLIDGRLYAVDDRAKLWVIDPKTGKSLIRRPMALGRVMRSTPLYADGKLFVTTANGRYYVLKPDDKKGAAILAKGAFPRGEACHGSPIVSGGRVFIPTSGHMYCFGKPNHKPAANPIPAAPKEDPIGKNRKVAHIQVLPAEVLLRPDEKQSFSIRLFNSRGQLLSEKSNVTYSLDGPGAISAAGVFTSAAGKKHTATTVVAKIGELTGSARIRTVSNLPWKFDFSDGQIPITWVGIRYRHVIRKVDGNDVMVKISTIPKGTRSQGWMGHPDLKDYTIQADVFGRGKNNKTPDIGITAQGYILDMRGTNEELQIRSWGTQLRMATTIPFKYKADTWYTLKLRVEIVNNDGKQQALIRGKVWLRGEEEPKKWRITATDDSPNMTGSPGLFGNATDAEIYLDNFSITPNEHPALFRKE